MNGSEMNKEELADALLKDEANRLRKMAKDLDPMTDLEKALVEWRDARKAFFAVPPVSADPKVRFPPIIWNRLAHAEHRLMTLAEHLQ